MEELREKACVAAIAGRDKLIELIQDNGRFIYAYDHKSGMRLDGYNKLRHWGSVWSILHVSSLIGEDGKPPLSSEQLLKVYRAIKWGIKNSVKKINKWNNVEIDKDYSLYAVYDKKYIKSGGQGLALLAINEFFHQIQDVPLLTNHEYLDLFLVAEGLYEFAFLVMVTKNNGWEFLHKINMETQKPTSFESEYYIGELLFGLTVWEENRKHYTIPPVFKSHKLEIFEIIVYLSKINYGVQIQSHWMIYAVATILKFLNKQYSAQADWLILEQYLDALVTHIQKNFEYRKRLDITPTSCRTEAVLAAVNYCHLRDRPATMSRIVSVAEPNIKTILQYCRSDGAVVKSLIDNTVQIDIIQHAITALAMYYGWYPIFMKGEYTKELNLTTITEPMSINSAFEIIQKANPKQLNKLRKLLKEKV